MHKSAPAARTLPTVSGISSPTTSTQHGKHIEHRAKCFVEVLNHLMTSRPFQARRRAWSHGQIRKAHQPWPEALKGGRKCDIYEVENTWPTSAVLLPGHLFSKYGYLRVTQVSIHLWNLWHCPNPSHFTSNFKHTMYQSEDGLINAIVSTDTFLIPTLC